MTRLYARAPKGVRAYGSVPRNRGKNTTLIASMTLEGAMGEAMAVEGSTKAFVFEAYVEYFLAPTLKEGQIVVMDNLGAHKTDKVKELIEERGCKLWFIGRPIHRISIPSKKPSRRTRLISGNRRRAREGRFWKRWVKRFRLLRPEMLRDGLLTAATNSEVNLHDYRCKLQRRQLYSRTVHALGCAGHCWGIVVTVLPEANATYTNRT
jgi:transposase